MHDSLIFGDLAAGLNCERPRQGCRHRPDADGVDTGEALSSDGEECRAGRASNSQCEYRYGESAHNYS